MDHDAGWNISQGTVALNFTTADASSRQGLLSRDARQFGDGGHMTIMIEKGHVVARLQSEDGSHTVAGGRVQNGRVHDIALTFGDDGMTLWFDGDEVDSNGYRGGLDGNDEKIVVGANNWASPSGTTGRLKHDLDGSVENVRLFDTALPDESIRALHGGAPDKAQPEPAPTPTVPGNSAPEALIDGRGLSMAEGQRKGMELSRYFSDADRDTLVFKFEDDPSWATIAGNKIKFAPGADDSGSHTLRVKAFDGQAFSDYIDIQVDIADVLGGSGGGDDAGGGNGHGASGKGDSNTGGPGGHDGGASSGGSGNDSGSGGSPGKTVTLVAGQGVLSGPVGNQTWGDGVTLVGYNLKGRPAEVAWGNQHRDDSFGIKGGRWDGQIDFYEGDGGKSEKLVIDFGGAVTDVVLDVALMGIHEGPRIKGEKGSETGKWTALDDQGRIVDSGLIGPELSMLGRDKAAAGSYGTYPIDIDADAYFSQLVIEATQFEHGRGHSTERSYGENNSDIAIAEVTYTRIDDFDFG
ncbi:hypothetical protein OCGS_2727 [Oceaniovalibus guishaninsula JLT2003]|uniref:Uncharacterized protein n=1 Tax=Oceaniovalibus guishaninsula JLT2003 TaxID=1231392 RepID=K2GK92_9RHOB|nr:hypothetical protein OCGS_2727 [Oceaniovalibus guishaninsula JLT2003]